MDKIDLAKTVTAVAVSIGVENIVSNTVKGNDSDKGMLTKACTWVGVMVLTGMLADRAIKYTDGLIDDIVEHINSTMVKIKE